MLQNQNQNQSQKEIPTIAEIDLEIKRLQEELRLPVQNIHQILQQTGRTEDEPTNVAAVEEDTSPTRVTVVPPSSSNKDFIDIHSKRLRALSKHPGFQGSPTVQKDTKSAMPRDLVSIGTDENSRDASSNQEESVTPAIQFRSFKFKSRKPVK